MAGSGCLVLYLLHVEKFALKPCLQLVFLSLEAVEQLLFFRELLKADTLTVFFHNDDLQL
jgi:hypothetical protein